MSSATVMAIRKAALLEGNKLTFRDAVVSDAAFILSLRIDAEKSRYLSPVKPDMAAQEAWLQKYAETSNQAYFIIEHRGEAIGTVRLYDPKQASFCWGSWILNHNSPVNAAIESALMVYAYAVDHLGFQEAHFDVRKDNESVWRFHERFGALKQGEKEIDYQYKIDGSSIAKSRIRFKKYLADSVKVVYGDE